ncbi:hypothetical protein BDZ94DRAFT_1237532 [Collybia nuda]|uniref:Uncharacterized protein n=1 Tax=Collybia nuda TaxID=64659 RepID=A0A9P6CGW4_9AGAR|nr:hypothetical protein BDZ94DRAFT_1237532 [Collybia nuda]
MQYQGRSAQYIEEHTGPAQHPTWAITLSILGQLMEWSVAVVPGLLSPRQRRLPVAMRYWHWIPHPQDLNYVEEEKAESRRKPGVTRFQRGIDALVNPTMGRFRVLSSDPYSGLKTDSWEITIRLISSVPDLGVEVWAIGSGNAKHSIDPVFFWIWEVRNFTI